MTPIQTSLETVYRAFCDDCHRSFETERGAFFWLDRDEFLAWLDDEWRRYGDVVVCPTCQPLCDECGEDFEGSRSMAESAGWASSADGRWMACPDCQTGPDWRTAPG
jgi:hypothetical protein